MSTPCFLVMASEVIFEHWPVLGDDPEARYGAAYLSELIGSVLGGNERRRSSSWGAVAGVSGDVTTPAPLN